MTEHRAEPSAGRAGYHHGDLRAALLSAAAERIAADGVDAVTLRGLARAAGVSHAAPAHHFGDRAGLFTALAVQGFDLLTAELTAASDDFHQVALAYIRFALQAPGHYEVMFRSSLLRAGDAELVAARLRSGEALRVGVARTVGASETPDDAGAPGPSVRLAAQLAAWSLVHGFAALWRDGALEGSALRTTDDPDALARTMIAVVGLGVPGT